jgi:glyoxylase-like metal-dependent hydrolase (beta-lactamase superfamily II)
VTATTGRSETAGATASISGVDVFRVGDVTITQVQERVYSFPIMGFIPDATPDRLTPHVDWLIDYGVTDVDTMTMPVNGYLLESSGRRILVDTCVGLEHSDSEPTSPFIDRLRRAGFPADSIDLVVCTHFHYDHVGWNTTVVDGERLPTFGRARYLFAKQEWEAVKDWTQGSSLDEQLQESFDRDVAFIVDAGRCDFVSDGFALTPEITILATPGHSPGHLAVAVDSDGHKAIITGDAIHHPVQLVDPALTTAADDLPSAAVRTREGLIDRVMDRDVLLIGSHFGSPGRGFVRSEGGRTRLIPVTTS